jgi:Homing endonuclease associated repeat
MSTALPDRDEVLNAIRTAAQTLGRPPSRSEFKSSSGTTEYQFLKHFPSWREAVRAAGLEPHSTNVPIDPRVLLEDWGEFVRRIRQIPTRDQYRRDGTYSPGVFEKRFGPWSAVPSKFREFADGKPEWSDVVALLPIENARPPIAAPTFLPDSSGLTASSLSEHRHTKLADRPTYGNPIDFRGLRHEPVNEQGVVFLFGMVARELGYHVEAVQTGFPDCEAKRQVDAGKWQRVRIEFEFESRNFRDHGHSSEACDIIVCWRHNWPECPPTLEVVELMTVIRKLSASEE